MKKLAKLVMLLAVLAFCLPADGEILIFNKTVKCWWADAQRIVDGVDWTWQVGDERITGYLILDVEYDENGEIDYINSAEQVDYWREGRERWYEQEGEGYDVERIEIPGRTELAPPTVYWVLEDWDTWSNGSDGIWFVMLRGKARMVNIGLGWAAEEKREVASVLEGCCQYWENWLDEEPIPDIEYIEKEMCSETLRLHPWWTRLANDPEIGNGDFEFAVFDIVKAWLEWLGYEEIDGMVMPIEL